MSDNTARLAREWAESRNPNSLTGAAKAAREHIMATTDPLTMADLEWDDEKHHLAGATTHDGEEVVMVWPTAHTTDYITAVEGEWARKELTPNGKKYELREVSAAEPAHPATLVTEQDYENAPYGTIVDIDGTVAVRGWAGWYLVNFVGTRQPEFMFHQGEGDVIRWGGWGK